MTDQRPAAPAAGLDGREPLALAPADHTGESIAFDPAVADYDRTRALPPEVREALADVLAAELLPRGLVLEVGVGTGRIALPLAGRGVRMIGVDLSASMLAQLRANAGPARPFPLVQADVTRLPFRSRSLGAVLAVHVLHLIRPWRIAAAEMARVVRPGGVLLIDPGIASSEAGRAFTDRFEELLGDVVRPIGLEHGDAEALDEAMRELGLRPRELPAVPRTEHETWGEHLRKIRDGRLSWTWRVPAEERRKAVEDVWAWGEARFGDLDTPRPEPMPIRFRAYDVPPAGEDQRPATEDTRGWAG